MPSAVDDLATVEQEVGARDVWLQSKYARLVKELRAARRGDSTSKALVFSQYTTTVTWLREKLTLDGFGCRSLDGTMSRILLLEYITFNS